MDTLLMMKDEIVMRINVDLGKYEVVNEKLVPWTLKDRWRYIPDFSTVKTQYDDTQRQIAIRKNYELFLNFLASRVLPITRDNAKKIYGLFGFEQLQDDLSKAKIAILCRAVSLQDNYWLKSDNDSVTWKDVDLRSNSLNEIVAQVSLNGASLSLTGTPCTPELTGQGAYAKAWFREKDGLYLHKRGANGSAESRIETMVSRLLDNCDVDHLEYVNTEEYGTVNCVCKCMTSDRISMLSGMDFDAYCRIHKLDPRKEALRIDSDSIYKMWIVDYLISNRDRHGLNWGFFFDCDEMEIKGCHPLYDHNNAFDTELMKDDNAEYLYDSSMTMKQAATIAMKHIDFHFYREFTKDDFITERQYESFMRRAQQLGIKTLGVDPDKIYESIPTLVRRDKPRWVAIEEKLKER